jgi:predicted GNAT family N-acyltransferase
MYIFFNFYLCDVMGNTIIVKTANDAALRKLLFEIRHQVFVLEQGVPDILQYDEYETSSTQIIALINHKAVGTCRYRSTDQGIKLERFAVLQEYRGLKIGSKLMQYCLSKLDLHQTIYLHAQAQVVPFYASHGFIKEGQVFEEAGIKHFKMQLQKP